MYTTMMQQFNVNRIENKKIQTPVKVSQSSAYKELTELPVARDLYAPAPWQTTAVRIVYLIFRRQEINKNIWGHSEMGNDTR